MVATLTPAEAFFLPGPRGPRFCLYHRPRGVITRAAIVQVPAFAEEMNKSRRMGGLQSRAFAEAGCAVLQIDLLGTGDSSGEFEHATWPAWRDDVLAALTWLRERHPEAPLWLWGLRAGCLLVADAAAHWPEPVCCIYWQPVTSGLVALRQFLRLRMAATLGAAALSDAPPTGRDAGRGAKGNGPMQEARLSLASGQTVEIAGYPLSAELAAGLEQSRLVPPRGATRIAWFEVSGRAEGALAPASVETIAAWHLAGGAVESAVVEGAPFWQTAEIETAPALIEATIAAVLSAGTDGDATRGAGARPGPATTLGPLVDEGGERPRDARLGSSGACITQADRSLDAGRGVPHAGRASPPWDEQPLHFDVDGQPLLGLLASPKRPSGLGVLVIVGGPQYRTGSHRQFVLLARALAAAGYPTLRFDHRGLGDSGGAPRSFEALDDDIAAALQAFRRATPALRRFAIWGLCDGASAALMHSAVARDERLAGLCLVNPWARSGETLARAQVKHYYTRRVLEPAFWRKLVGGDVGWCALRELAASLRIAWRRPRGETLEAADDAPYTDRMARAWQRFEGRVLLILSGNDLTAKEFLECVGGDPAWRGALDRPAVERVDIDGADHTFSAGVDRRAVEQATLAWLDRLECGADMPNARRAGAEAVR